MKSHTANRARKISDAGGFRRQTFDPLRVRPRKTSFEFPADEIPTLWVGDGSHYNTQLMNSLHLFLPVFEDLLCRVFKKTIPAIENRELVYRIRGFIGQEASHSRAHRKFWDVLRAQGYRIDGILRWMSAANDALFGRWLGRDLTISCAAAFEHYTDLLVHLSLETDFFDASDPRIREFLAWHAAEEIEHNAVAYELLREINSGYWFRQLGHVIGLTLILASLAGGTLALLAQDGRVFSRSSWRDLGRFWFTRRFMAARLLAMFWHYARPAYHPDDGDYSGLARSVLDPLPPPHGSTSPDPQTPSNPTAFS